MKTIFSILALSILCFASLKTSFLKIIGYGEEKSIGSSRSEIDAISTILLEDSAYSTTIQCNKVGNVWTVSSVSATSTYLALLGNSEFNINAITNFQDIEAVFDSLYTSGSLTGIGSKDGKSIPIGIQYVRIGTSGGGETVAHMRASVTHTCTGSPCSCCKFEKDSNGGIVGCYCSARNGCAYGQGDKCNHTMTTTK